MNLICGLNPVLEALQAGTRHFDRLIVVKGLRNQRVSDAIARASRLGVPLRFESRETLDRMAGGVPHQGVVAVVSAKPTIDLDALLDQAREPALVVALDGVEDPRNLGAILRTCEAAGADGVILPERHSSGLTETVSRASAGALEHVRVARVGNLAQAVEALKARGLWVIGFDAGSPVRWNQVDYKRPLALVFGGEGRGIRRLVRERCDEVASIPLFGHVTSLNVSVAAGVALFEVIRQRGSVPTHVKPIPPKAGPLARLVEGPAPGDSTHDPGANPAAMSATAAEADEELAYPISVERHDDEDVAWGHALLPSADTRGSDREPGARSSRDQRGGGRRPEGRPPQERPRAAPDAGEGALPQPQSEARSPRGPRSGRRRRKGRGGGPSEGGASEEAKGTPEGGSVPGAAGSELPAEAGPAAPAGKRPGRRRRWRRRKGSQGQP